MSRSIPSIFADALACETPDEVAALLDEACGSNADMRHDVERLLAAHQEASGFLEPQTVLVDPSITIGTVIGGRYKLLEAIGEGGMGTVWVAEQTEPVRRKVAIKLVRCSSASRRNGRRWP
jgi:serine/threonine protein kinase